MPAISVKFNRKQEKALVDKFKMLGKEGEQEFEEVTKVNAKEITRYAKSYAPSNKASTGSDLKQSIHEFKVRDMGYRVQVEKNYGPYVEFGTGTMVDVQPEWREMAWLFKGKGIKQVNISPQPFLYPAYRRVRLEYIRQLEKTLETLIKK